MPITIKPGNTIYDAAFSVSGSLAAVDQLIEQNTPQVNPIPDWNTIVEINNEEMPASNYMESYSPNIPVGTILNTDNIPTYNLEAKGNAPFNSGYSDQLDVEVEILNMLIHTQRILTINVIISIEGLTEFESGDIFYTDPEGATRHIVVAPDTVFPLEMQVTINSFTLSFENFLSLNNVLNSTYTVVIPKGSSPYTINEIQLS